MIKIARHCSGWDDSQSITSVLRDDNSDKEHEEVKIQGMEVPMEIE